jgi:Ca-activated chloride channel family protein
MNLTFAQPAFIITGLITCVCAFVYLRVAAKKRRTVLARFVRPELASRLTANVSPGRRRIKDILFLLAVFCCFLALARPQYGEDWIEVRQKGIDMLIAVDTSRSMLARDIQPNRLARAKLAIKDFVFRLEGDRIGLMPFAGTSFLMCPLTTDYSAFLSSLDSIGPDSIPVGGTDLAGVISSADKILEGESNHKILILVTDGEDLKGTVMQAAELAAQTHMTIYTVGVGTSEGELIPNIDGSKGSFIKDNAGNFVRSRLDETMLTKISELTGGLYVPLGTMGQGFTTIYQQKLKLVPREEHHERMERRPIERFYWPLALAIFLLTVEFLLSGRKPSRSFGLPLIKTAGRRLFIRKELLIIFLLFPGYPPQLANGSTGDEFYQDGDYKQAESEYIKELTEKSESIRLQFNLGDAQYKAGAYEKAIASYTQALDSDDLELQAQSYYNRGNARYRLGKASLKTNPEHTMELYSQAIKDYEGSLALHPEDADATFNRDLVKKQLEELKKQQQEKESRKDKQNKDNKKEEEQKKEDEQSQSGQDSSAQKDSEKQDKKSNKQSQDQNKQSTEKNKKTDSPKNQDKPENKKNSKKSNKAHEEDEQKGQNEQNAQPGADPLEKKPKQSGEMSKTDQERRQQGKMTIQEARDLLDALEGEEGRLDFIPQAERGTNESPLKNW